MSCRNTPSGSLATTYIQRLYGLTDAQSTSLYHELVRRHTQQRPPVPVTPADYNAAIDQMEARIRSDSAWSESLRSRALDRVRRARQAGLPTDPARAYAFTRIARRAEFAREDIQARIGEAAEAAGLSTDEVAREFRAIATDRSRSDVPTVEADGNLPGDAGTRRAVAYLRSLRPGGSQSRCSNCQQYLPASSAHVCPSEVAAPALTPRAVEPQSMEEFQARYDAAREAIRDGNTRVPSVPELEAVPGGVTGGLGHPETGMSFGIELEIDFPDEDEDEMGAARQELARRLYEEGITSQPFVARWHHVGGEGQGRPGGTYQTRADGWVCEFDRSVDDVDGERGVEIKSQILFDEPETWNNLRRICAIAEELGGRATPRCGTHVNIDSVLFSPSDPTVHTNLIRLANAYDDVLVRLAHNPESGPRHRGRSYCGPNYVPPSGYHSVSEARGYSGHYQAVNFTNLPDEYNPRTSSSRVEMRLFDSTLDPARIQAQVALSLSLVSAARHGEGVEREAEPAGTHRDRYQGRRLEGQAWEESTESFRSFASLLGKHGMGRPEQQQQLAHLFAASKWQSA